MQDFGLEAIGEAARYAVLWNTGAYAGASMGTPGEFSTPLMDKLTRHIVNSVKRGYLGTDGRPLRILEVGAGSGGHAVMLVRRGERLRRDGKLPEGLEVIANDYADPPIQMIVAKKAGLKPYLQERLQVFPGDISVCLRAQPPGSIAATHAQSVYHGWREGERRRVYSETVNVLAEYGIVAGSFKAAGDHRYGRGELLEQTAAGPVCRDTDTISRLFVEHREPLIGELRDAGLFVFDDFFWPVQAAYEGDGSRVHKVYWGFLAAKRDASERYAVNGQA